MTREPSTSVGVSGKCGTVDACVVVADARDAHGRFVVGQARHNLTSRGAERQDERVAALEDQNELARAVLGGCHVEILAESRHSPDNRTSFEVDGDRAGCCLLRRHDVRVVRLAGVRVDDHSFRCVTRGHNFDVPEGGRAV